MADILQDFRSGYRWMRKRPGLACISVVSLALGIGANVAVFSVADALLFRPFRIAEPHDLMAIRSRSSEGVRPVSAPDYRDMRDAQQVFLDLAAFADFTFSVRTHQQTERLQGELVSATYFDVLGVIPRPGRGFSREEDEAPSPVVVISQRLFRRRFGEDENVLGKTIRVNGQELTVVGIAPEGFRGITLPRQIDLWIPLSMIDSLWPRVTEFFEKRDQPGVNVVGRLREATSLDQADAAMKALAGALERAHPDTNQGTTAEVVPFGETRLSERARVVSYLGVLLGVAGVVLLIASANVAGLRLADLSSRGGELGMRRALGAARSRLARLVLVESGLVYALSLAGSLLVARLALWGFGRVEILAMSVGELEPSIDLRVFAGAVGLTAAAAALSSLAPILFVRRASLPGRSASLADGPPVARLRGALVAVQVALACVLLVGAGLLVRTIHEVDSVDPGYRLDDVLFVSVDLQSLEFRYDQPRAQDFYRRALERISSLPRVRSAAWSADIPFGRMTILTMFVLEEDGAVEEPDWIQADADIVTPGFLETMGIPLLSGRDFTETDGVDTPGVVLVNETLARTYWPGEDAVGKKIRVWRRSGIPHDYYEIVGVVRDAKYRNLWDEPRPYIYFPLAQRFFQYMNLHVYSDGPPLAVLPAVREAIRALDDDLPLFDARLLSEERKVLLASQRSVGLLFTLAGLVALVLSVAGTYGITASVLASRRAELGVRIALGAGARHIRGFVLRKGLGPVLAGLVAGIAASIVLTRFVEHLLIGVDALDGVAFACAIVVLGLSGVAASYLPARRASSIDPAIVLRNE
ncbi:MAG TPA: ABC transporter permease [Vicinamibacteria bacterium]|nr:ABC transporter permease [Vicinamibacteria bacterium]